MLPVAPGMRVPVLMMLIWIWLCIAVTFGSSLTEDAFGSPDLVGVLPTEFLAEYEWFSSAAARQCLRNKRIAFIGDSTMIEMTDDFAVLLSGIGGDRRALDDYVYKSTHVSRNSQAPTILPLSNSTTVSYFNFHRNMTVSHAQDNIFIHYRFTGHHDLFDNGGGVRTFLREELRDELDCILGGDSSGCPKPDVVIINSGLHDDGTLVDYAFILNDVLVKLKLRKIETILWRGTLASWYTASSYPDLLLFDRVAKELCKKHDIPVMDGVALFNALESLFPSSMEQFTRDYIHYGSIARFAKFDLRMTLSSMMTQETMRHLCPTAVNNTYMKRSIYQPVTRAARPKKT